MAKKLRARVLVDTVIEGSVYKPDQVIEASPAVIKALGGSVDASSAAVKYCVTELGAPVRELKSHNDQGGDQDNGGQDDGDKGPEVIGGEDDQSAE